MMMTQKEDKRNNIEPTVIQLADYGGKPDSGEDATVVMQRAIEAASRCSGPVVLECAFGRYDFFAEQATKRIYHISNTTSEEENPDVTKTIGLFLDGLSHFTLEGNGALFIFHGKQTMFAADKCKHIEIRNVNVDYERPTVVEMTVVQAENNKLIVDVHPDFRYELEDGKLFWVSDDWRFRNGPMQELDLIANKTWRIDNIIERAIKIEELEPNRLLIHLDYAPIQVEGRILQARDGIRDQVGAFLYRSSDIRFTNVGMHFMHGLGIVCQFSENLCFERMNMTPREETGRTVTAFADFIHVSGCRGTFKVTNSRFSGGHDDPINVHGTHLRVVGQSAPNQVLVRFMHAQTYGFEAFYAGDEIEFVKRSSLIPFQSNSVVSAVLINPREMLLTLENVVPAGVEEGDVVENVTWTPEVEITKNEFERVPTRGILATTRRKVVIGHNHFEKMTMSAILVADDAESWYESGRVEDIYIHDNHFIECGNNQHPVISIAPENTQVSTDAPVHCNIHIDHNRFQTKDATVLSAKSTRHLSFTNNDITAVGVYHDFHSIEDVIRLEACTEISLAGNSISRKD